MIIKEHIRNNSGCFSDLNLQKAQDLECQISYLKTSITQ